MELIVYNEGRKRLINRWQLHWGNTYIEVLSDFKNNQPMIIFSNSFSYTNFDIHLSSSILFIVLHNYEIYFTDHFSHKHCCFMCISNAIYSLSTSLFVLILLSKIYIFHTQYIWYNINGVFSYENNFRYNTFINIMWQGSVALIYVVAL